MTFKSISRQPKASLPSSRLYPSNSRDATGLWKVIACQLLAPLLTAGSFAAEAASSTAESNPAGRTERYESGFVRPDGEWTNVVLIVMDQIPWNALGCYGHPLAQTPNLDSLAEHGTLVQNAFTQHPTCVPSRATQLTGLYPSQHGLMSNLNNLELMHPWARMLPDGFAKGQHITGQIGKWHAGRDPRQCHWDEFRFMEDSIPIWPPTTLQDAATLYTPPSGSVLAGTHPCNEEETGMALITDDSLTFLDRFAYQPFFLRVSYMGTHPPVLPPKPWDTMYDPDDIVLPEFDPVELANRPSEVLEEFSHKRGVKVNDGHAMTEQDMRVHIASMLGVISYQDAQVGRILRKLDELGIRDRTLVVFTTDHGAWWGEYGMIKKSGICLYDAILHIPLLFSMPGTVPEGHVVEGLMENADLAPTLLDFAGLPAIPRINGRSMKDAILGDESATREDVFAESSENGHSVYSIRTREWNFIWHSTTAKAELYHWSEDPHERFNLADDPNYQSVRDELMLRLMQRKLQAQVLMTPDPSTVKRSPIYWAPGQDAVAREQNAIDAVYHNDDD